MTVEIVFETHAWTEDNERGIATGWCPGRLSVRGRSEAVALGERRRDDDLAAVFTSDLRRATETADLAFAASRLPVQADWHLRECNYGRLNGAPARQIHSRRLDHLSVPYPGGESWQQAVERVGVFLRELPDRWAEQRVLLIGHLATRWALDHLVGGSPLEDVLVEDFHWRPGWEYRID